MVFTLRLLCLLGVLPVTHDDPQFHALRAEEQQLLRMCRGGGTLQTLAEAIPRSRGLEFFCSSVLLEHLPRRLRAPEITAALVLNP